jgi:hypothetical protein
LISRRRRIRLLNTGRSRQGKKLRNWQKRFVKRRKRNSKSNAFAKCKKKPLIDRPTSTQSVPNVLKKRQIVPFVNVKDVNLRRE